MPNVISDIAGQYDTLMALLKKMPDDEPISIGDMVDRGPNSRKVLDFFMNNGRAILGNHEHMMLDWCLHEEFYDRETWLYNGGRATLKSFDTSSMEYHNNPVPDEYLKWLGKLPLFLEIKDILVSHSFIVSYMDLKEACQFGTSIYDKDETTIIWNREPPIRRPEWKLQLAGHNSQFGLRHFSDKDGTFAICLDDCKKSVLTGINTDTLEIFQQEYLDK